MLPLLLAVALLQEPAAAPPGEAPAAPAPSAPSGAPAAAPAAPAAPRPARPARREKAAGEQPSVLQGFGRPTGKRFTGEFDDTEVDDALRQITKAAGLSIVFPPGHLRERVTANFQDAPVEEALRAVLLQAGLLAERQGTIVTVRKAAEAGPLAGLPAMGESVGREVQRRVDEAMREADRETRRAQREASRAAKESDRDERGGRRRDRVVQGDVLVHAGDVVGDVVALRGNARLEAGAHARDVVAILGSVTLDPGAQAREAVAVGGDVHLGAGAQVQRDAVSVGGDVKADPSAEVGGEVTSVTMPDLTGLAGLVGSHSIFGRPASGFWTVGQLLAKFVVYFVLALALVALFPRRVDAVATGFAAHPWKSVLTGLLGVVVAPIVLVLLVATIIGIPLVPVAAILLLAAGVLGFTALAAYLGRRLPVRVQREAHVLQLALGTAMVVVITSIPILGCMAWITAALLTFGAVLRTRFGTQTPVLATTVPPPAGPPPAAPA